MATSWDRNRRFGEYLSPTHIGAFWAKRWSLLVSLAALLTTFAYTFGRSFSMTAGHLVYALDDPYNEMATARNMAQHGVWGMTPYAFTSTPSSPLWTFLLAISYWATGVHEATPLVLNVVLSLGLVAAAYGLLSRNAVSPVPVGLSLLGMIFLTPVVPVAFTGLEHILQSLLVVLMVSRASVALSQPRPSGAVASAGGPGLLLLAALLPVTRYEGLLMVGFVALLFALRRRWAGAVLVVAAGASLVTIYGLISMANGWFFLPNGVLIKGTQGVVLDQSFPLSVLDKIAAAPHIESLLLASGGLLLLRWRLGRSPWDVPGVLLTIFMGTAVAHMAVAQVGWFYRYEAYLVALGILAITVGMAEILPAKLSLPRIRRLLPQALVVLLVASILVLPLVDRGLVAQEQTPVATEYVYENNYDVAQFLHRYYQGQVVAASGIGAIDFYSDFHLMDLAGVADMAIARAKLSGTDSPALLSELAMERGVRIAITAPSTLEKLGGVPPGWVEVGRWTLEDVFADAKVVAFYAVDPTEIFTLAQHLAEFSSEVPRGVSQSGSYLTFVGGDAPISNW